MKNLICQDFNTQTLVSITNGEVTTTSRIVAEAFNKQHKNVIQGIENILEDLAGLKFSSLNLFEKIEYLDAQNKRRPEYLLTRDGFTLLAMGFTGSEALEWKLKYISAFNEMERRLSAPRPDDRLELARLIAKVNDSQLHALKNLYPEYFTTYPPLESLEYRSEVNTSYLKWLEDYGITKEWVSEFPTTHIFNNYVRYCTENRLLSMGKKKFYKTLESDFNLTRRQLTDGFRYFEAIVV